MYEDLIKSLKDAKRFAESRGYSGMANVIKQAADAIAELQEGNAALNGTIANLLEQIKDLGKPRWIPVTERLPKKWTWVLVCFDGADVPSTGFINSTGDWIGEDMYTNYGVTYWMPLPEPPKDEIE